jgi:hypothetical protein
MTRKALTREEHFAVGEVLAKQRDYLVRLPTIWGYPMGGREERAALRALKAVDELRCVLDSAAFRDMPKDQHDGLVAAYYPGPCGRKPQERRTGASGAGTTQKPSRTYHARQRPAIAARTQRSAAIETVRPFNDRLDDVAGG